MKASTFAALLLGDLDNAVVSETPGGIEAQEAAGQQYLVKTDVLPRFLLRCTQEECEQLSFVFGQEVDDVFRRGQLPPGWRKVPTDHSMWTELRDEQDHLRGRIFYKAAFYDRRAGLELLSTKGES